jgi:hypothetical protein
VKGGADREIKEHSTAVSQRRETWLPWLPNQKNFGKTPSFIDVMKFWRNLPTKGIAVCPEIV